MKLTPLNLVLLALTVLLAIAVALTREAPPSAPPTERAFPAFDPATILSIEVARSGEESVLLTRASAAAPWAVAARGDFAAEPYPIERLLDQIANLQARDLVSESADGLALFGLGPGGGIEVTLQSPGNADWRFVFADARAGGQGYVRAAGDERVFGFPSFVGLSRDPRQWLRPQVLDFEQADVRRIEIALAGTVVEVERDDKGIWRERRTGRVAPRVTLEDLLGDLDALALIDVIERGDEEPGADGLELRLLDAEGGGLAALVLDLKPGDQGRRRIESRAWAEAGHPRWIGLIDDATGAQIMKRVTTVIVALDKKP